jgi:uncharacterized membrane-anchored protein YhcB (DUF1043 family)
MENLLRKALGFVVGLAVGACLAVAVSNHVNWQAHKFQSIETELRTIANNQDSLHSLLLTQSRKIDTLENLHPWRKSKR